MCQRPQAVDALSLRYATRLHRSHTLQGEYKFLGRLKPSCPKSHFPFKKVLRRGSGSAFCWQLSHKLKSILVLSVTPRCKIGSNPMCAYVRGQDGVQLLMGCNTVDFLFSKLAKFSANFHLANDWACFVEHKL